MKQLLATFGRYELLSRLASGGMGEVWLAHLRGASGFEKRVVVKIMLPHVAEDPKLVEMFVAEASVAAQLSHPNIIQIYELGVVEGRYFIAMEYVAGRSLRQIGAALRKQSRPMPVWFLLAVMGKICQGLHYAHELCDASGRPMGLAHRDVSPENIMVSFTGDVKLIDFGALRLSTGNTHPASRKEDLVGKFSYMAPEQVRGVPASRRTDMYSVGEVLYEYLTGVRPYEAPDEASLLHKVSRGEIIDPAKLAPHLPDELLEILRRVLAYDPKVRWADAADLADALLGLLKDASLPFDQTSIGLFLANLFSAAPDVPKVVHQELARRSLPARDLIAATPTPERGVGARRRIGDTEDSVQIEVEDLPESPAAGRPGPAAAARPPTVPLPAPRRSRPSTPALLASALPPPLPATPRPSPMPAAAPVAPPGLKSEPGSWPMASPVAPAAAATMVTAPTAPLTPLPRASLPPLPPALPLPPASPLPAPTVATAEGTEERATPVPGAEPSWPELARGGGDRSLEQASARLFEGSAPPRVVQAVSDVFAATRSTGSVVRELASLFGRPAEAAAGSAVSAPATEAARDELDDESPTSARPWPAVQRVRTSEADLHFDRGLALLANQHFEEALAAWEEAYRLDPQNGKLRVNLRRLRQKLGRD